MITSDEIERFWQNGAGIAIVTGISSGNLEVIDFDDPSMYEVWRELNDPAVLKKLVIIQTPRGGFHCYYRAKGIVGGYVLARKKDNTVAIETRGVGNYAICPPTKGYKGIQGSFAAISTLQEFERDELLATASQLNEGELSSHKPERGNAYKGDKSWVDQWRADFDFVPYMESHGWTVAGRAGDNVYLRRPGKTHGKSASWNGKVFYCFTSSSHPFTPSTAYSAWDVVAILDYNGSLGAAAKVISSPYKTAPVKPTVQRRYETSPEPQIDPETGEIIEEANGRWIRASDVVPKKPKFLFEPYLPIGMFSLIAGDPGVGKTTIVLAWIAHVTRGTHFLTGHKISEPRNCIFITSEDSPEYTVVPRLIAAQADLERVLILPERLLLDESGLGELEQRIVEEKAVLVVIDPIISAINEKVDMHKQNQTRAALDGLVRLAAKHEFAPLGLIHLNKGNGVKALYRVIGSIDFIAIARSVLLAGSDPDDKHNMAVAHIKSNVSAKGPSIGYEIDDAGRLFFTGDSELDEDRMCEGPATQRSRDALDAAKDWIRAQLSQCAYEASQLLTRALDCGVKKSTFYAAGTALHVERRAQPTKGKGRGPQWWALKGYDWSTLEDQWKQCLDD